MPRQEPRAEQRWSELNATECQVLQIIFMADQMSEQFYRHYYEGDRRIPASVWRWMVYDSQLDGLSSSTLYKCAHHARVDALTLYSAAQALSRRGLGEVKDLIRSDLSRPHFAVRLTRLGRRTARQHAKSRMAKL